MLKIQSDRIIIDGHEPTKEQCETMTLFANALAESESFKTIKYESGYAEFEKVGKTNILNFVPAPPQDVTVIFDSHIISVNCPSSGNYGGGSWTTSGSTVNGMYDHTLTYYVTLEDGYVIDTVVVSGTEPYHMPVISDDKKSFTGYLTAGEPFTITITSKQTVSRKSIDLTTLPGWSSLSSGSHSITIVAKADGYRDSEPSSAVSVEKAAAMPVKGDLITIDSKQYRVLKINDTIAEVLCMYDASTSQSFNNSRNSNAYADSSLDFYLTQSFYKSLSTTMQNAIVAKTFRQDSWYYGSNSSAIAKYNGTYQTTNNYTLSLMSTTFGAFISRKCYVLSCQDVIDYLEVMTSMGSADTTLTSENVWRMFWNQTTSPGPTYPWLRSARSNDSRYAFYVNGNNGRLSSDFVDYNFAVRPAFQIDLSKVDWTKQ